MDANGYMKNQKDILDRIDTLEGTVGGLSTLISRLGIDTQQYVKADDPIVPGIGCKVAYDRYGLVRKGMPLDVGDIPDIPIEKVINLRETLNQKSNTSSSTREIPTRIQRKSVAGTGIKINYDDEGHVLSSSDLLESDIPDLPIERISGLIDRLRVLEEKSEEKKDQEEFRVTPGTFAKISYDSAGRVTKGSNLTLNDIPSELLSKLNVLESNILSLAPKSLITSLQDSISKKLDANDYMTPGTYMKVRVDSKGLVTGYENITKKDLPPVMMSDIDGLEKLLRSKADQSSFIELHETIATLSSLPAKVSEITSIKTELSQKATKDEVSDIKGRLTSINSLLQTVMDKIPNDTIIDYLEQIRGDISAISGRVAVLEKKFSEK